VTKTYTPAPRISLTGATTDIRFDVAEPLFGSPFSGTYLDTVSQNMSGAFYIQGIGWALMSTGSYQVKINCGIPDLKDILPTTPQCQFTGSGWAENIGELSFADVHYNPSTGKLSGSIGSWAGDLSVDGVSLPLRPVSFVESITGLIANHSTTLTVQSGSQYGDGTWELKIMPLSSAFQKLFTGSSVGNFTIDLSLADTYTLEVTDPQGSQTEFDGVIVSPNTLSQTLDSTSGLFIQDFCVFDSTRCPDGIPRSASKLEKSGVDKVADGASYYDFTLKPRDKYGNRVVDGDIEVSYTGTISSIQLPTGMSTTNTDYFLSSLLDPVVFQSVGLTFLNRYTYVPLSMSDITYSIASMAPTDASNTLVLDEIKYTSPTGVVSTFSDTGAVTFAKPYTATITPPTTLLLGTTNHFVGALSTLTPESLSPELITTLLIGDGLFANMSDLISDPAGTSKADDIDWMMGVSNPSSITIPTLPASFWFTGTYSPYTAYPELEKLAYQSLIHYQIWGIDVIYPVASGDQVSEYKASRIKILGQNNARAEYGTVSTTSKSRADVFNQIRKSVALMMRNRDDYSNAPYEVYETNTNITDANFNTKKTIVVIGADVMINGNLDRDTDGPLAIIALTKDGVGGNIHIDPSVTDVNASLFAEHAVLSSGDRQLYIGGSLVSGNTLGETAAGICPYYVTGPCDAKLYDLEEMRTFDGSDPIKSAISSTAGQYPGTALIIEYDMRLQTDPPPGLSQ
jgi:hypothetical protein